MKNLRLLLILAVCLLAAGTLTAQTFRGGIAGTVTDASGAVVPNAKVTLRNVDTGVERSATSDADGNYVATELPIGNYSVTVEVQGFQTAGGTPPPPGGGGGGGPGPPPP